MLFWYEIFLSILQGSTEFLPVSSSGHLALFQILFNKFKEPPIIFDLFLHLATIFSVLFYYRKKLKNYLNTKSFYLLFSGLFGTALVAFPLKNIAKEAFASPHLVSIFLFITGIVLFFANKIKENNKELNLINAFIIGIFQGFAIFPGLSRSGITISAGLALGLPASVACEFSFILSIPTIFGANFIEFLKEWDKSFNYGFANLIVSFLIAFFVGLIFLNFTNKIFLKRYLTPFSFYCIIISALIIGANFYGKCL